MHWFRVPPRTSPWPPLTPGRVRVLASADAGSVPLHAAHMVAEHDAWHMEAREGA